MSDMETREVKLGDIVKYNKGYAFKSSEYTDEGVMVVRVTDFTLDSISDVDAVYLAPDDRYDKFILKTNDILIQTVGSWANNPNSIVGKVVRVPNQCDSAYLNQNIVRIIPNNDFDNTYLFYVLRANQFSTYCVLRGQGAANQASITLDTIFRFKFKVHNFAEQKRIADILSAYDNLIENNNKRIRLLEQMAENLYKEWFVRFRFPGYEDVEIKNDIPKNWSTRKLKDIVKKSGKFIKRENLTENLKYVPIDCIDSKTMVLLKNDDLENASSSLQTFKTNDILFGAMRPYFHKVSLSHFDGVTRTTCFVIAPKKKEYKYFLYLLLFQEATVNFATTISVGSTMPYVRWEDFIRMNVVVPDIETAKKFSMEIDPLMKVIQNLSEINKLLARQRDLLLPRLMSGKLEV